MKSDKNPISIAFEESLRAGGFAKKGNTWYRDNPDVLEVMHLQRSQFGPQYYINYALWLKVLGEPKSPKEVDCHIRMRESNFGGDIKIARKLLDLESDLASEERSGGIVHFMSKSFFPFSNQCRTLDGMRLLFKEGRFADTLIVAAARKLLS